MQNKTNFLNALMNVTCFLTKDHEQLTMNNELIKTNPNKSNFVGKICCPDRRHDRNLSDTGENVVYVSPGVKFTKESLA